MFKRKSIEAIEPGTIEFTRLMMDSCVPQYLYEKMVALGESGDAVGITLEERQESRGTAYFINEQRVRKRLYQWALARMRAAGSDDPGGESRD